MIWLLCSDTVVMRERNWAAVLDHCECMKRMSKSEVAAVKEARRCLGQFCLKVGDLSGWRCLELEVEVFYEVVDTDLAVENLPLSSQ